MVMCPVRIVILPLLDSNIFDFHRYCSGQIRSELTHVHEQSRLCPRSQDEKRQTRPFGLGASWNALTQHGRGLIIIGVSESCFCAPAMSSYASANGEFSRKTLHGNASRQSPRMLSMKLRYRDTLHLDFSVFFRWPLDNSRCPPYPLKLWWKSVAMPNTANCPHPSSDVTLRLFDRFQRAKRAAVSSLIAISRLSSGR